jgi:hypothetical protein
VTLNIEIGWRKVKHAGLAQRNGFSPAFLHSLLRLVKGSCAPARAGVTNMIWLLLPVFDWPTIMIGPCGLLLVVSDLFAVPVFCFMGGVAKM